MYDIRNGVRYFLHAQYICMILKVVDVCFGVVLCSEVGNVALHALPTPGAAVWIVSSLPDVVASRPSLRSLMPP